MSAFRQVLRRSSRLQDLCCGRSLPSLESGLLGALPGGCQQSKSIASSSACNAPIHIEDELYCRQRQLLVLGNRVPVLAPDSWVAPNAVVIGDVDIFDQVRLQCSYICISRAKRPHLERCNFHRFAFLVPPFPLLLLDNSPTEDSPCHMTYCACRRSPMSRGSWSQQTANLLAWSFCFGNPESTAK